jgi:hypothetical protein
VVDAGNHSYHDDISHQTGVMAFGKGVCCT